MNQTRSTRLHYAWVVVAVTFLMLMLSMAVRSIPGVIMKPLQAEFDWTKTSISSAVAISLLIFGFGAPLAGTVIDRYGPRRVMIAGMAFTSFGLALMIGMTEFWQLHLFWGLMVGVGTGVIGTVIGAAVVNRWFNQHRGIALGLVGAAGAVGQFVVLPYMVRYTTIAGWQFVIAAVAGALALAIIPVALLMRDKPSDMGLEPLGGAKAAASAGIHNTGTPLREALRTRDFWLLALSFFVCGFTTNGLIGTHLLPHAIEHGLPEIATAEALGFMGLMNVIGTLASGWLTDRVDNRKLLTMYYGLRGLSLLALPFANEMNSLYIFAFVYGLDWIATVPPTANLTAQRFGRASLGSIYGWIYCSHMIGSASAAQLGGIVRDTLGSYQVIFIAAAVMGMIAAMLASRVSVTGKQAIAPAQ